MADPVYVVLSLDVEEEGLFSGKYASQGYTLANIEKLLEFGPFAAQLGFPLTLFCDWAVFNDPDSCAIVRALAKEYGAEIAAHLHHWSTPPFRKEEPEPPERTDRLDPALLQERLQNLLQAGRACSGHELTSFRMGRWDLKARLLPLLAENGVRVDSSICPLRIYPAGPDHFLAPAEPYWLDTSQGKILEAPVTQIPISRFLAKSWAHLTSGRRSLQDKFHFFGCLSANPVWHRLSVMKLAVKWHLARGGRLINFFLHSSELLPGASPNVPNEQAAEKLTAKIAVFCRWLSATYDARPITMSELADLKIWPEGRFLPGRDW